MIQRFSTSRSSSATSSLSPSLVRPSSFSFSFLSTFSPLFLSFLSTSIPLLFLSSFPLRFLSFSHYPLPRPPSSTTQSSSSLPRPQLCYSPPPSSNSKTSAKPYLTPPRPMLFGAVRNSKARACFPMSSSIFALSQRDKASGEELTGVRISHRNGSRTRGWWMVVGVVSKPEWILKEGMVVGGDDRR